jgi:hypothetical protein
VAAKDGTKAAAKVAGDAATSALPGIHDDSNR